MLVILDRDGVINHDSDNYIKNPDEWIPFASSLTAIAKLNQAGHVVVIATNQSGVGRGLYNEEMLRRIHEKLKAELAKVGGHVDAIYYCPHTPTDNCACRKPKPGLLRQIEKDFSLDLTEAFVVGDSLRDIQSAQNVGAKPVLVMTGNGRETLEKFKKELGDVLVFENLMGFVVFALDDSN